MTAAPAITRDAHGVAHVAAASADALWFGLGTCHARDRGLQMLLARLVGQGRAAEWLDAGDETVRLDRFFRRLDLGAGADAVRGALAPDDARLVDAYCAGATRVLERRAPWELRLLGYRPEPWSLADVVLVSRMAGWVALAQSQADMERLLVELVQADVPREHLDELFPGLLADLDVDLVRRVRIGERLVPEAVRWHPAIPRALASNNWVLAGSRTASGLPLLANDPHLEANRLPAVWYEAVLERGARFCIAATMPGMPGALLGRTNDLAWGATYAFMDAVDSWIEDCRDGRYRRTADGRDTWLPFRARTEVIRRRRRPPVTAVFHENPHGVLDGDPAMPGLYLATRWAAADGGAASLAAILALPDAPDVARGMALVGRLETAFNWVLADRHGAIGYQMSGTMPRRGPGRRGLVPLPGWDPANDWQGVVPPEDLPRDRDPACGFLVTANDDLNHLGRAHPLTLPMGDDRAARIRTSLGARADWDVARTRDLQLDVRSPHAARFLTVLRPLLPDTAEGRLLRDWDCGYGTESRGATLFERFYRTLVAEVFGRVCGREVLRHLAGETGILADFYANFDAVLLRPASVWYGAAGRDAVWRDVAAHTVVAPAPPWGTVQRITLRHLLFGGRLPAWLGFDRGPIPLPGGRGTIRQGQVYRSGGRQTSFAPSFRLVTDFAEPAAHTSLAGGPSDRRWSRWYASEIARWVAGDLKRLGPHLYGAAGPRVEETP